MKGEVRYREPNREGETIRRFRNSNDDYLRGRIICELDVAFVEITSTKELDQIIEFLEIARRRFTRDAPLKLNNNEQARLS